MGKALTAEPDSHDLLCLKRREDQRQGSARCLPQEPVPERNSGLRGSLFAGSSGHLI